MENVESEAISKVVIAALKYTATLPSYTTTLIDDPDMTKIAKTISLDMRSKLPEAVRYVVFQIIVRLAAFASEQAAAFEEERTTALPKPRTDIDYTVRRIWLDFIQRIEKVYREKQSWNPLHWNPYTNVSQALRYIGVYIGDKHFAIDIRMKGEKKRDQRRNSQQRRTRRGRR